MKDSIQVDKTRWKRMTAFCKGASEETITEVHRLEETPEKDKLPFPATNVNDGVMKLKFDNAHGCRHSLPDGIVRATDVMICEKRALVCGYGDVDKGCAFALRGAGARVLTSEIDPICALQACIEGFQVVRIEQVIDHANIFVSTTDNKDGTTVECRRPMRSSPRTSVDLRTRLSFCQEPAAGHR